MRVPLPGRRSSAANRSDWRSSAIRAVVSSPGNRSMARRFELEMNILARLQHPGIAQIYDAGASDSEGHGDAYFVMELVRGPCLTDRTAELGVRERLELVARVCDAVHHAHQRGVIHRDLKPGNVLVDLAGGSGAGRDTMGQPKVLDFGVATIVDAASPRGAGA